MNISGVTHIALRVPNVREAEAYYCALFDLAVAWREAYVDGTWRTLPDGKTWDDAEAAGLQLSPVFLWRGGFGLALEHAVAPTPDGQLSHVGILVDPAMFAALRLRAPQLECLLHVDGPTTLVFDDKYGVRWEPTTHAYDNPMKQSSGATSGLWLAL
jgi:catechol 2,3-dioxygenase-like lactoylglutathione lyase family enzyme